MNPTSEIETSEAPKYIEDAKSETNKQESVHKLDLSNGQDSLSLLDTLGPLVVNVDGSTSRITNWEEKTESEKQTIIRVLGKRNKARLEALNANSTEGT